MKNFNIQDERGTFAQRLERLEADVKKLLELAQIEKQLVARHACISWTERHCKICKELPAHPNHERIL